MSHEQFRRQVCDLAQMLGWKVQWHWRSFYSPAGFPDLLLVRDKRILAVELKVCNGKGKMDDLTAEQYEWLELLRQTGKVETYLWTCEDTIEDISEVLR